MFCDRGLNGLRKPIKDFSGGPVVKTLSSQCRVAGCVGSTPCWGTKILHLHSATKKKKKGKKEINQYTPFPWLWSWCRGEPRTQAGPKETLRLGKVMLFPTGIRWWSTWTEGGIRLHLVTTGGTSFNPKRAQRRMESHKILVDKLRSGSNHAWCLLDLWTVELFEPIHSLLIFKPPGDAFSFNGKIPSQQKSETKPLHMGPPHLTKWIC